MNLKFYSNPNVHSISMGLYFKAGTIYEEDKVRGISHLLEHMFFRHLNNCTQKELYYRIEKIGGTLRGTTYVDFIKFDITVASKYFDDAFDIISEILKTGDWTSENIKKEKAVVLKQIEYKPSPSYEDYIKSEYFKGLPLSENIMGNKTIIKRMSIKDVNDWKRRIFTPNNSCFVMTGNYTDREYDFVIGQLSKVKKSQETLQPYTVIPKDFCKRNKTSDLMIATDGDISDVSIMFDLTQEDLFYAYFISSILGEGDGSRLSLVLREEMAITDEVYSKIEVFPDSSILNIVFSCDTIDLAKALSEVFKIIEDMCEKITDEDIEQSKVFFSDNLFFMLDDTKELNFYLGWKCFIQGEKFSLERMSNDYSKLTKERIRDRCKSIFVKDKLIIALTYNSQFISTRELKSTVLECRRKLE